METARVRYTDLTQLLTSAEDMAHKSSSKYFINASKYLITQEESLLGEEYKYHKEKADIISQFSKQFGLQKKKTHILVYQEKLHRAILSILYDPYTPQCSSL
jgi:hypothetical protein